MRPEDFTEKAWGKLVDSGQGAQAFVPHPLPPPLVFSPDLVNRLSGADRAVGELAGQARNLPNPYLFIRPMLQREAVLSSRIEGTQTSVQELILSEADTRRQGATKTDGDVLEVRNYVWAMEYGLERIQTLPLCLRFIRELHEKLMRGVRGDRHTPGEFRRIQNYIAPPGAPLSQASYVPPPHLEMTQGLDALEKFIHAPDNLPPLLRLALVHYQFEAIHPFSDGNGRVGRLLLSLMLCSDNLLSAPCLHLSGWFEKHRQTYYDRLLGVSQRGEWEAWLLFFLEGVATEARAATRSIGQLVGLWQKYRAQLTSARSSALPLKLVDELFRSLAITIPLAAKVLAVTPRSATLTIEKLIDQGVLVELKSSHDTPLRPRLFLAREILRVAENQESEGVPTAP